MTQELIPYKAELKIYESKTEEERNVIPFFAMPSDIQRNEQTMNLGDWLDGLLSLDGDKSVKRLEVLLPMIKDNSWRLSVDEVKEAFTMYAQGKLPLEPRDNYLTVVLYNKVIQLWKNQRTIKPKEMKELSEEEKDKIKLSNELTVLSGVINCFDAYVQTGDIITGYVWIYKHLDELNILNFSGKEKIAQMPLAKEELIKEKELTVNKSEYKSFMISLENNNEQDAIKSKAKNMLLCRFFAGLHAKGKHIKDLL